MALQNNPTTTPMPNNETLALFLIGEELKSRRVFNTLQALGLENSYYQPHLDEMILRCVGLTDDSNETFEFYSSAMDGGAGRIGIKQLEVCEEAKRVYEKLTSRASTGS